MNHEGSFLTRRGGSGWDYPPRVGGNPPGGGGGPQGVRKLGSGKEITGLSKLTLPYLDLKKNFESMVSRKIPVKITLQRKI